MKIYTTVDPRLLGTYKIPKRVSNSIAIKNNSDYNETIQLINAFKQY